MTPRTRFGLLSGTTALVVVVALAATRARADDVASPSFVLSDDEPLAATFNPVPNFERIKTDIDMVGNGLEPLLRLDEELQELGRQLTEHIRGLSEDQNNAVLASEANKLITKIQVRLVNTIGEVLVNSDLIELGIDSANRKLNTLERYLKRTEGRFKKSSDDIVEEIENAKHDALDAANDYLEFVDSLQEPVSREDKLKALQLEARVQEQKFQLDLLKLDRKRQAAVAKGYSNMGTALGRWIDDFNVLKSKTKVMVKQLEAEERFLARGIQMNVDAARVRHFMENPLALPDGTPIQAVNEKIAKIFTMIEVFTGVQGRVQESLFGFNVVTVADTVTNKAQEITGMKKRAMDLKRQIMD
jgi:hypothetical protein